MAKKLGPEFTYDLTELRKVDPALIHYTETSAIATGLAEPRGIAVGLDDRLYVAGDKAIRSFDASGKWLAEVKTAGEPQCVAVGPGDVLYAGAKKRVETYDPKSGATAAWPDLAAKSVLTGITVFEDHIFVADAGQRIILYYDTTGRLIGRIDGRSATGPARDVDDTGFIVPSPYFDVAAAGKDVLWVANPGRRRVECYAFDGTRRASWGRASPAISGFCGCCNPAHIALLPGGGLVTSEKGLPRVKTYTTAGELVSVVAPPAAFDEQAVGLDVAADSKGRILVLDPLQKKVRVFVLKQPARAEATP